jgi:hypothetical protein
MALPTWVGAGAYTAGVGAITPPLPASLSTNDILILFVESSPGDPDASIANQNGGTWTQLPDVPQSGSTTTELNAWWSRYNGTQGDPTTNDPGNHISGVIIAVRGCETSGDPFNVTSGGNEGASDTSLSITGDTTTVADCFIVAAAAFRRNATGTNNFTSLANTDLANLTERVDAYNTAGVGTGLYVVTGEKATAGSYGATTATSGVSSNYGFMTIALKPPSGTLTGVALTTTPSLPAGRIDHGLVGVALSITPTLPAGAVQSAGPQTIDGVALTTTPSLPAGRVDLGLAGVALSTTPTLPAGRVDLGLAGVALSTTPSLPAGRVDLGLVGQALSVTPTLPAGSITGPGDQSVTGVALSTTPALPAGRVDLGLVGQALSVTPTLPAGQINQSLVGQVLTVTPTLPQGSLTHGLTGVVLSVTPTLPAGSLRHTVLGQALTATPTLPPGVVVGLQTVTGVVLVVVPTLPIGQVQVPFPEEELFHEIEDYRVCYNPTHAHARPAARPFASPGRAGRKLRRGI